MIWGKKRKPRATSDGTPAAATPETIDLTGVPDAGPVVYVPIDLVETDGVVDLASDWETLGERAWDLLQRRRMGELWPGPKPCEFQRYLDLLRRSPAKYREEVFIGLKAPDCSPVFVPRTVFGNHAYVLGGSGSGKTSSAMAQLLIQLSEAFVDAEGKQHPYPPVLIMDLKQNGDRYLRALARRTAAARRQRLQFFSNDPEYQSLHFEPLYSLRTAKYPIKMLETLLKAFSMIYPEGYGSDFFTNEQRVQLLEILYSEDRPETLDQLVDQVRKATRRKGGNTDARGLYSALASLQLAMHVHGEAAPLDPRTRLDFDRFFDERQILYVHLDTRGMSLLSRDIGKLILFALLETASQREKEGQKTQAYVFIDEFHRLAARNVVEMLEDARGAGLGFILAHQSSASLQTRDADLYGILFENCSFKQCLTLEDPRVIKLFQTIAGRTTERRWSGSLARGEASQAHTAWSQADGPVGLFEWPKADAYPSGPRKGHDSDKAGLGGAVRSTESTTESDSWQDELVSAFTPEMIQQVNDTNLLSLVHVKGVGARGQTPLGGAPTLVQCLYPFTEKRAHVMERRKWPMKEHLDPEEYYRKARPTLDRAAVAAVSKRGRRRPAAGTAGPSGESPQPAGAAADDALSVALQQRLLAIADRMAAHMLAPPIKVEVVARQHKIKVDQLLGLAAELGLPAHTKEDLLRPREVALLEAKLGLHADQPKDNGPQEGPVV